MANSEAKEQVIVPLDLLRSRITKLTSRILFKLEDRSGFPLNPPIYQPGAIPIPDGSSPSFLEYSIRGLEEYHGVLGRWQFPDEHPLIISAKPTIITRNTVCGLPTLPNVDINVKDALMPFYTDTVLPQLCEDKDEPDTYGETAYLDADVLELLNERINLGRYVAQSKVNDNPEIWNVVSDTPALIEELTDRDREKVVINNALKIARRHGLNARFTRGFIKSVIAQTINVEVAYLQGLPSQKSHSFGG